MFDADNWYAVAGARSLRASEVTPATVGGVEAAVWRDSQGGLKAYSNFCIHRGMRLSHGYVKDDHLVCRYHGWRYHKEGECDYIPALPETKPAAAHCLKQYKVGEAAGLVWLCVGEPEQGFEVLRESTADFGSTDYCRSVFIDLPPEQVLTQIRGALFMSPQEAEGENVKASAPKEVGLIEDAGQRQRYSCVWSVGDEVVEAEYVSRILAPGLVTLHSNMDDMGLILACQPISDNRTGIHLSLESSSISPIQRLHFARWATELRWCLEREADVGSLLMAQA